MNILICVSNVIISVKRIPKSGVAEWKNICFLLQDEMNYFQSKLRKYSFAIFVLSWSKLKLQKLKLGIKYMYFYLLCNYRTKLCLNGNKSTESNSILKINNIVSISRSFYVTFLQTFPKTDLLLDNESQGSGVFLPELDEPEYCNAQNTALWELHALRVRGPPTPALSFSWKIFFSFFPSSYNSQRT